MTDSRKTSGGRPATDWRDDGSGRVALIGLFVVLALLVASARVLGFHF